MDDKNFVVVFLDLVSSLPENIGATEYQCPIITDSMGKPQFSKSLQSLLDHPNNAEIKAWATIERVKNLF